MLSYANRVNRVLALVLVAKLSLAVGQAYAAHRSGSLALVADALNSFFDASTVIIGLVILRLSTRPPDDDHPFGHRKFETVSALVVAGLLFLTAFEVGRLGIERLLSGAPAPTLSVLVFGIVGVSLVVNLGLMVYERRASRALGSELLAADAANARGDVMIHVSVLVGFLLVRAGYGWADAAVALGAAGIIAWEGSRVFRDSFHILTDGIVFEPTEVAKLVEDVPGVLDVHDIRSVGHPSSALVSMHLVVDHRDVEAAHAVTETVENRLRDRLGAMDVVIHVEPSTDAN